MRLGLTAVVIGFAAITVSSKQVSVSSQIISMKKMSRALVLSSLVMLCALSSQAQIVVRVRPARPARIVVRRPPPPSPNHVWIDEDWRLRGGRYVYSGGYWAAAPRPGAAWIPGHWANRPRGYVWIAGHWR